MFDQIDDTIIQLSTPYAVSAIHLIRISGKKSLLFINNFFSGKSLKPRQVYYGNFISNKTIIDNIIVIYFKNPASYTGEDMVEIHCHGSLLIVKEILKIGIEFGLRLADPGEFTKRAFLNQKLNLQQAEAIDVLIKANSDYVKNNALNILEKKTSINFNKIEHEMLNLLSGLESRIEFPDDVSEKGYYKKLNAELDSINRYFSTLIANFNKGKRLDEGLQIVIAGRPNSGKSTLMNAIIREERVLVSPTAGTTRDFIKEQIFIKGFPVSITDTAGLRSGKGSIEKEGIKKGLKEIEKADIIIFLIFEKKCLTDFLKFKQFFKNKNLLIYCNKTDLLSKTTLTDIKTAAEQKNIKIKKFISLTHDNIIDTIEKHIYKFIKKQSTLDMLDIALLNQRQAHISSQIIEIINIIHTKINKKTAEEIIAEDLKEILSLLQHLNIKIGNEDIINNIFKNFCIGK